MSDLSFDKIKAWMVEHGDAHWKRTTEALLKGAEVDMHWAAEVLAAEEMIRALVAEVERLRGALEDEHQRWLRAEDWVRHQEADNERLRAKNVSHGYEIHRLLRVANIAETFGIADLCENFPPGSALNCYVEPPEGWAVRIDPCLHCALAALHPQEQSGG